jgi:hypothetical protein
VPLYQAEEPLPAAQDMASLLLSFSPWIRYARDASRLRDASLAPARFSADAHAGVQSHFGDSSRVRYAAPMVRSKTLSAAGGINWYRDFVFWQ